MARENTVHQGAIAPYKLKFQVSSTDPDFDLSTVTAATFDVLRPIGPAGDQTEVQWTAAIAGPSPRTAELLELEYTFVSGDLDLAGEYIVEPRMSAPSGTFVADPRPFVVREKFT